MKRKGFTLVELLAVIAILAILVIIALPNVLKMYNTSKKNIFLVEAKEIYGEVAKKYMTESMKGNTISYISSEDNTKLNMTGESLKYCIKVGNGGKITSMKIGNNNYYLYYDGSIDISKIDISQVYEGKYNQKECNASTVITKDGETPKAPEKACTYDGEIVKGTPITIGKYTYHYKQDMMSTLSSDVDANELTKEIEIDGFRVEITDRNSTDPVTEAPCTSINEIPILSMSGMFSNSKATSIDTSGFNTSKVTNMFGMFGKTKAETLNLSGLDTSNVTDMSMMFSQIKAPSLDLSTFDTSKVTKMSMMFWLAETNSINFGNLNTSKVTSMFTMFGGVRAKKIDVSSFDTSNVTDMSCMFGLGCFLTGEDSYFGNYTEEIVGLNKLNTSKVTDMYKMFAYSAVTSLDLSSFDTRNVTNMSSMFYKAKATTGYAKTQIEADMFNSSSNKPSTLTFVVKK